MLSGQEIEDIVELDRVNMAAMMKDCGIDFSSTFRKAEVTKEIEAGTTYVLHKEDGRVVAYLAFSVYNDIMQVKSLQIAVSAGKPALRMLLRKTIAVVSGLHYHELHTKIFIHNEPALRLYQKLGFVIKEQKNGSYYLFIDRDTLRKRISLVLEME